MVAGAEVLLRGFTLSMEVGFRRPLDFFVARFVVIDMPSLADLNCDNAGEGASRRPIGAISREGSMSFDVNPGGGHASAEEGGGN